MRTKLRNKRMQMLVCVSLVIFMYILVNLTPASAIAIAKRVRFDPVVVAGSSVSQDTILMNDEGKDLMYNVSVEGNYSDWINFSNNDFTLKSGERAAIDVTVSPPVGTEPGNYSTKLRIVSMPAAAGGFALGAGVLLPVSIEVKKGPTVPEKISAAGKGLLDRLKALGPVPIMLGAIIVLLIVVIVMGVKLRRKGKGGGSGNEY